MTYQEALTYIHSVIWRGKRIGLGRITELLHKMGNPERELKFVHVAGTNGKGSTASMTASILKEAGYHTVISLQSPTLPARHCYRRLY